MGNSKSTSNSSTSNSSGIERRNTKREKLSKPSPVKPSAATTVKVAPYNDLEYRDEKEEKEGINQPLPIAGT